MKLLHMFGLLGVLLSTSAIASDNRQWLFKGNGLENTNYVNSELNSTNVSSLTRVWHYETAPFPTQAASAADFLNQLPLAGIRQPAAIENGIAYITDTGGNLTALNLSTGNIIWQKSFKNDLSRPGREITSSENTPAISGNVLIVGNHFYTTEAFCTPQTPADQICNPGKGAIIVAVDKRNGNFLWSTNVDSHPFAKIAGSPVIYKNTIYASVSSWEEFGATVFPADLTNPLSEAGYPCCTFRGSVVSLDLQTGKLIWQQYLSPGLSPKNGSADLKKLFGDKGFFGVTSYHPPVIDTQRQQIYVGTGNNYVASDFAQQCERDRRDGKKPSAQCKNLSAKVANYNSSIVALDMKTGKVKWFYQWLPYDTEVHACGAVDLGAGSFVAPLLEPRPLANAANCPNVIGPNNGTGGGVMLVNDMVVATTKGNITMALNPNNGKLIWQTSYGPSGIAGTFDTNHSFASDGKRIYTGSLNLFNAGRDHTLPFVPMYNFLNNNGFSALGIRTNQDPPYQKPAPGIFAVGFPLLPILSTFPNSAGYTNPPVAPMTLGPESGPKEILVLTNPPSDTLVDGVNVFTNQQDARCPVGKLCTVSGFITAMDARDGHVLWQRPANDATHGLEPVGITGGLVATNDIVVAGYADGHGTLVVLKAATGEKLFQAENQSTFLNTTTNTPETVEHGFTSIGISIVNDVILQGLGYALDNVAPYMRGDRLNMYKLPNN